MSGAADITAILLDARADPRRAADRLLPSVYESLRRLAERRLRGEAPDQTLQATALVHEAYLKLVDQSRVDWRDRTHFFAVAATAMRRILVDRARVRGRLKHGGGMRRMSLDDAVAAVLDDQAIDLLDLDEALERFGALHPDEARLVELRYFGGLDLPEAAESLGVSTRTAERWWAFSRAWLYRALHATRGDDPLPVREDAR